MRLYYYYRSLFKSKVELISKKRIRNKWLKGSREFPAPYIIKYDFISEIQKKNNFDNFVESGTYIGGMINYQKDLFKQLYSIELNEFLFERARDRFKSFNNITIILGDSGKVLSSLLHKVNGSTLFWLDGHYSSGITSKGEQVSPIFAELEAIFSSSVDLEKSLILIDDARLFTGTGGYPSMDELKTCIKSYRNDMTFLVDHDVIRIVVED